jgi:uncharacterized damage-inducible protein DinB
MNMIQRLKEIEVGYRTSCPVYPAIKIFSDDEIEEVFESLTKLLAFVAAYDEWLDLFMEDAREELEDDGSLELAVKNLDIARKALDEGEG